jgi:hypothetical protein
MLLVIMIPFQELECEANEAVCSVYFIGHDCLLLIENHNRTPLDVEGLHHEN